MEVERETIRTVAAWPMEQSGALLMVANGIAELFNA